MAGAKKGSLSLHQYTPCQIALRFMKSYISTPECAFYFSLLLSLDIYPSPEMLYMCVYIEPKWWISSCASCHVGDMPSDMALAPFLLSDFSSSRLFPAKTRKAKKKKKNYWTCTPHIVYIVDIRTGTSLYNKLKGGKIDFHSTDYLFHNTEAAWDDFDTAHWSRAKCCTAASPSTWRPNGSLSLLFSREITWASIEIRMCVASVIFHLSRL